MRYVLALILLLPVSTSANCLLLADMALVARSLTVSGIEAGLQHRIMAHIYSTVADQDLIAQMVKAGHETNMPPMLYAQALKQACDRIVRGDKEV